MNWILKPVLTLSSTLPKRFHLLQPIYQIMRIFLRYGNWRKANHLMHILRNLQGIQQDYYTKIRGKYFCLCPSECIFRGQIDLNWFCSGHILILTIFEAVWAYVFYSHLFFFGIYLFTIFSPQNLQNCHIPWWRCRHENAIDSEQKFRKSISNGSSIYQPYQIFSEKYRST